MLTGKAGRGAVDARDAILSWADAFSSGDSTWSSLGSAIDLAADHGLRIWDALILSVAAEQKCESASLNLLPGDPDVAGPFVDQEREQLREMSGAVKSIRGGAATCKSIIRRLVYWGEIGGE